jgi:hypothetical protein
MLPDRMQTLRGAGASRYSWDIRGMAASPSPGSVMVLERGIDSLVGHRLALVQALGIDAQEYLDTVPSPLGYVGSRNT